MKSNFWKFMMMVVIIAGTAFTFSSCRDDSEDNGNSIVGTWAPEGDDVVLVLCKDGTLFGYKPKSGGIKMKDKGKYTYNESIGVLTFYFPDGEKVAFEVLSLTSERMRLMEDDGDIWVFERVKDLYTQEELEKIYQAQKDRS